MRCSRCDSTRIMEINAKCSDRCCATYAGHEKEGYAPELEPIGGDDYIQIEFCLDCGQVRGSFPLDDAVVAKAFGGPVYCDECCEEFPWADDVPRCNRCGKSLCKKCGGGDRYCNDCAEKSAAEKEYVW